MFAVSKTQEEIRLGEGISADKISRIGNTVIDILNHAKSVSDMKSQNLYTHSLIPREYVLLTAKRASNGDSKEALQELCGLLDFASVAVSALETIMIFSIINVITTGLSSLATLFILRSP
jgi:UDP-N-acetylglucosamine 2-epimerase